MADLQLPPHYLERPSLSASIPGVTVVRPEFDDPTTTPAPLLHFLQLSALLAMVLQLPRLMAGPRWIRIGLSIRVLHWIGRLGASLHLAAVSTRRI